MVIADPDLENRQPADKEKALHNFEVRVLPS
jgi:hypothetical protein